MKKNTLLLTCFGLGVFLLIQVIAPLVSYKYWELFQYTQNQVLLSPDPQGSVLGVSIQNEDSFPAFVSAAHRDHPALYDTFYLSIPSINLKSAEVMVDSNNFDNNLALLPGAPLPGEKGNVFITGHSSLPQLFTQTNYKAIFSYLPNVKKGDQVSIEAGGQVFTYIIQGMQIVDPSQTWVTNPPDNQGRYLTLMTCVPPGLYLKRLIVLAQLQ